uniref:(northern house mosquito) hypothetical protein n=1 Tax=Culex pipiens TaxID=7175 RepID=A0A8D8KV94_CULPI
MHGCLNSWLLELRRLIRLRRFFAGLIAKRWGILGERTIMNELVVGQLGSCLNEHRQKLLLLGQDLEQQRNAVLRQQIFFQQLPHGPPNLTPFANRRKLRIAVFRAEPANRQSSSPLCCNTNKYGTRRNYTFITTNYK